MLEIKLCDKCKGTNLKTLLPKITKEFPEAIIKIGCINMCGIGIKKNIAIINNISVVADTEDILIEQIKKEL